jgi:septal ring factor EnvC (AmiA/AmiB activator)
MNFMRSSLCSLLAAASLGCFYSSPTQSKTWTVEQRQAKLMQDINSAQKSGQLTAKDSRKLRKSLADIAREKKKLKAKSNGKLSPEDIAKLQKSIDETSSKVKLSIGNQTSAPANKK